MKVAILYNLVEKASDDIPLPSNWNDILRRFKDSYCEHPAGIPHDLYICTSGAEMSESSRQLFGELDYRTLTYMGNGWDIGAYQHCAKQLNGYDFVLFMNSQTFVVADRWLSYFADAYVAYGPGIYGASSSFEVAAHIRTSAFAASPQLLLQYSIQVRSRYDACVFEHSPMNFSQWVIEQSLPVCVVMRSGIYSLADSRQGANIFRRGTQEDLIINDRHTLVYAQASDAERRMLEQLADGLTPVSFIYEGRLKRLITNHQSLRKLRRVASILKHRIRSVYLKVTNLI